MREYYIRSCHIVQDVDHFALKTGSFLLAMRPAMNYFTIPLFTCYATAADDHR